MPVRLFCLCCASIILYILSFGLFLERPLSLGFLNLEIQEKTARLKVLPSPKLVILAGSNGPYSHSCAIIGDMLGLPCENAGIAVGIGLDDLFARYAPALRQGDIVYMPMEVAQYVTSHPENNAGADGAILLRYDRDALVQMPAGRVIGAVFSSSFLDFLECLAEMPAAHFGVISAPETLSQDYNEYGDRIGTSLATANRDILANSSRALPPGSAVVEGFGASLIRDFVAEETKAGVMVIGGLPTDFATVKLPPATLAAIRSIYKDNGGAFMILNNLSLYPKADFYDSEDHLAQPCQYKHSIAVAERLGQFLRRSIHPPSPEIQRIAQTCPA